MEDLLRIALRVWDSDADWASDVYWAALIAMRKCHGVDEVFRMARGLYGSADPHERALCADMLGCLGVPNTIHADEAVDLLLSLLLDADDVVVSAAAFALARHGSPRSVEPLARLASHPDPEVRCGVAYALGNVTEHPLAMRTLIDMSTDCHGPVRSTATFALALADYADREVTNALRQRVRDEDPEVRGDALLGLAYRKEPDVVDLLERELSGEQFDDGAVKAAEAASDLRLLPILLKLRAGGVPSMYLDLAIKACSETGDED